MAISTLLALSLGLAIEASQLVARHPVLRREQAKRGGEHVVRDRLEGHMVAVIDEPDARHTPPPADLGRKRDLPARRDLHGGHGIHHIDEV
jgi:hypothetical protein